MTREQLQTLCESVVADQSLQPKDGKTFCNIGLHRIAKEFGVVYFAGKLANDICDILEKTWTLVDGTRANEHANSGKLAIAGLKAKPHGHVAVVFPGAMVYSGKWKKECPVLANVGVRNAISGANYCFPTEPQYYIE